MKIINITTQVKQIELKTPFKTALRETLHVEFARVHVEHNPKNFFVLIDMCCNR